nr:hypothetical protein [Nocardioides pelophilus]
MEKQRIANDRILDWHQRWTLPSQELAGARWSNPDDATDKVPQVIGPSEDSIIHLPERDVVGHGLQGPGDFR